jgi:hypothetical protein
MPQQTYTVEAPDGRKITLEGPAGASSEEIIRQAQLLDKAEPMTLSGFASNLGKSGKRLLDDLARAAQSPLQTVKHGVQTAAGLVNKVIPGRQGFEEKGDELLSAVSDRYRTGDRALRTVYDDPMGVVAELSALTPAVKTILPIAGRGAKAAVGTGKQAAGGMADRLYESALKPGPRSNTLPEVRRMVRTGLNERIPVSGQGVSKTNRLIDDINTEIASRINAGTQQGVTVNKFKVASRLNDPLKRFSTQVNPELDLATLSKSGNEFIRTAPAEIPAGQAQAMKQGTYRQLKNKSFGELKGANIESQKALARGLKEELAQQIPEIQPLNTRESNILSLKDELEAAVNRNANRNIFGISTPIVGTGFSLATGSPFLGTMAGTLKEMVGRPSVKSRLAIGLSRFAGPRP